MFTRKVKSDTVMPRMALLLVICLITGLIGCNPKNRTKPNGQTYTREPNPYIPPATTQSALRAAKVSETNNYCIDEYLTDAPFANSGEDSFNPETDSYSICTREQFFNLGNNDEFLKSDFVLMGDIIIEAPFESIINNDKIPFEGYFDGNDYSITLSNCDETMCDDVRLFQNMTEDALIKNLTIRDNKGNIILSY